MELRPCPAITLGLQGHTCWNPIAPSRTNSKPSSHRNLYCFGAFLHVFATRVPLCKTDLELKRQDNPHTMRLRRCVIEGYLSGKTKLGTGLEHLILRVSLLQCSHLRQSTNRTELQATVASDSPGAPILILNQFLVGAPVRFNKFYLKNELLQGGVKKFNPFLADWRWRVWFATSSHKIT